jgi:hypothetical protein
MNFLVTIMRSVHYAMGISVPSPDRERFYLLVWLGILLFTLAWVVVIVLALLYFVLGK